MEAVGATRLPYLNSLAACPVAGTGFYGGVNWFLVPNFWDPFRDSWDLTEANVSSTLTPNYLRPPVRISVSGSVNLGTIPSASGSGSIPSATPSSSPAFAISPAPQSVTLTTGTAAGRDGFVQASTVGTADCTPAPTATPSNISASPPTPTVQWVNIPWPSPTPNPPPVGGNVVFRIAFPGNYIPTTWTSGTQNPVLMLMPGFQMTLDYRSHNGSWYSYSFLQGNSASPSANPSATPHNTWISGGTGSTTLNLVTNFSRYGPNPAPSASPSPTPAGTPYPTIVTASPTPGATGWNVTTLAQAPMFAKADPRSIRYNSLIGVINLSTPTPTPAAGIIRSIWPSGYTSPPPMTFASTPAPTPTPPATPTPTPSTTPSPTPSATPNFPNPATLGDNAPAGNAGNPYNEVNGSSWRPMMMNRPFRSVGEMGYAFRDQPFRTLSFSSANSPDAGLLDLFSVNDYSPPLPTPVSTVTPTPTPRGGVISLNSSQAGAIAGVLTSTITREDTPRATPGGVPWPAPSPLTSPVANSVAASLVSSTSTAPLVNRAGLATLIASIPNSTGLGPSAPKTERESIARALGEADQTRTWNLLIDVIAQSGRYKPNPTSLQNDFIVEGEQHYWVHVAIDRFTGQIIDRQFEAVKE
jgi:hypothetical protein